MTRTDVVLAALAAGGRGASFDGFRVQKLLFLIDAEIPVFVEGPHFRFRPCRYGPFDQAVYRTLEELGRRDRAAITERDGYADYALTAAGAAAGRGILAKLPDHARQFMARAAEWLRLSTFRRILTVIYHRYPEMAANTAAPDVGPPAFRAAHRFVPPSFLSGAARILDFTGSLDSPMYGGAPDQEDAMALRQDWEAVGDDIERAWAELGPPAPIP